MDYIFSGLGFMLLSAALMSGPMPVSILLLMTSVVGGLTLGACASKWMMYILMLVFTGGMMVMVLYISNLAAQMKIISWDFMGMFSLGMFIMILSFNLGDMMTIFSIMKYPAWELLCFIMSFLLLILFFVVFLVEKSKGALR